MENWHQRHETVGGFGMDAVVQNLTFDSNATQKGIERAATKVAGAVEKSTDKVTEAIKRISTTNAVTAPATSAIHESLKSVAVSTARIADYIGKNPSGLPAAMESVQAVCKQFSELTDHASRFAESAKELRATAGETVKASDWIGSKFPSNVSDVSVSNAVGRMVDFS